MDHIDSFTAFYVRASNFVAHFGHLTVIFPFPFGTLNL